ncbi:MAG: hsp70 family protein, partial [Planctomycetes bacterium]|nr:hsp70 family protein [Planctomycetota bacterium]
MSEKSLFIIGVDLGTTNCVVSYVDTASKSDGIRILEIPQLVEADEIKAKDNLPSFVYFPFEDEAFDKTQILKYAKNTRAIVGEFARKRGSEVPGRLASSAKSWLSHAAVDRRAKILPWSASEGIKKISPVTATTLLLEFIRDTWNREIAKADKTAYFELQDVIVTIPASFDAVARELTVEATKSLNLEKLTLLEEPQAAFYSWIHRNKSSWQQSVFVGETVLVCDIGGGTSDFSLIQVERSKGKLAFRRVAVGQHLMLGGDNIDLAIAVKLEQRLKSQKIRLDAKQWSMLQARCRDAKEKLLSTDAKSVKVTIPGTGSSLIGGSFSENLNKNDLTSLVLDGFMPEIDITEKTHDTPKGMIREFGLPYAFDPAISKHLAEFLNISSVLGYEPVRPHKILFNGGFFKSAFAQKRMYEILQSWFPEIELKKSRGRPRKNQPLTLKIEALSSNMKDLDNAVAIGAAFFGLAKRGKGIRIQGGSAHSFYIEIDAGEKSQDKNVATTLCICPHDQKEAEELEISERKFCLKLNQPVSFPVFSTNSRRLDDAGDIVKIQRDSVNQLPPVCTVLKPLGESDSNDNNEVIVRLKSRLNEIGVLEVWFESVKDGNKWRLQFDTRQSAELDETVETKRTEISEDENLPKEMLKNASEIIRKTFLANSNTQNLELKPAKLMKNLENVLERKRADWSISTLRHLFLTTLELSNKRKINAEFEIRWLNLTGFLLRPGFGAQFDEKRCSDIFKIFDAGVQYKRNLQAASEFWILWRRIAAGLDKQRQMQLYKTIAPILLPRSDSARKKGKREKHTNLQEEIEMWRTIASLEKIPAVEKTRLGSFLIRQIQQNAQNLHKTQASQNSYVYWCIGRLGARVPFNAPVDTVVSRDAAQTWVQQLLSGEDFVNDAG